MSWGELMVIGGVALIVIGPKDLPKALRTVGQMTTKVRRLAGEFQSQFTEAMREAELDDVKRDLENINRNVRETTAGTFNPIQTIRDELKTSIESRPAAAPSGEPGAVSATSAGMPEIVPSSPETAMVTGPEAAPGTAFAAEEAEAPPVIGRLPEHTIPAETPSAVPIPVKPLTDPAGPGLEPVYMPPERRVVAPARAGEGPDA